ANEKQPLAVSCDCRSLVRSGFANGLPAPSAVYYVDWEKTGQRASFVMSLSDGVRVAIRIAEPVQAGSEIETSDKPYTAERSSRELRLLALARYWNAIHYFYGYPGSLERWDAALTEFIPQFEHAETQRD